ncbi:MAG: hypothetical protein DI600_00650 [Cutibacterium granulosum]|nr:MAG: hypothetical protein DI600_00650 [Cutibacterium granulosum]
MRTYGAIGQDLRAQDLARCGGSRWARHQQEGPLPAGRDRDAEVPPIHVILLDLGWVCEIFIESEGVRALQCSRSHPADIFRHGTADPA